MAETAQPGRGQVAAAGDAAADRACRPRPDPAQAQYVVGYGSLMQEASRKRTSPRAGPARPVEVNGYGRGWYVRSDGVGWGTTFLAAVPSPGGLFNAVLYQVDLPELAATDRRETSYCRARISAPNVRALAGNALSDGEIWIYLLDGRHAALPSESFPVVQSYVDIFVGGCLEQQERFGLAGFSAQCVRSTSGWSEHWIDDRIYPRRPFIFEPRARQIDAVLAAEIPKPWSARRLEGAQRGGAAATDPGN